MAATDLDIQGALVNSSHKFRKEILMMPVVGLGVTRSHMTTRFGVRGKETVGEARSGAKIRPYRTAKDATNTTTVIPRTLETMLGDVVEEFDPVALYNTVYSENISKDITQLDFVKAIGLEMARQSTSDLPKAIFTGVRDASGDETIDLFDGFDTICIAEKIAGNITVGKGNFKALGVITPANVGDVLKAFFQAAHQVLQSNPCKMFIPVAVKNMYDEWYLANFGPVAYNTKDVQSMLHMSNGMCELVALPGMIDSTHIFLSTKKNMLIGVDQISDEEKIEIRRPDNPKVVQFFMKMFFGVQFESISPEVFMAGSYSLGVVAEGDTVIAATPNTVVCDDTEQGETSTKTVAIAGDNLVGDLQLSVQGAQFDLSVYTITKAEAEASGGKQITITFAPAAALVYTGKIIATDGETTIEIPVVGVGVATPVIAALPTSVACDNTAVDATSTKTVVISAANLSGNLELAVQGAGFALSAYTITKADAEASGGKEITVTFAPLAAQAYTGKILITGGGASLTINLTGTGTAG